MSLGGRGGRLGGWGGGGGRRGAVGIICHNRLAKCKSLTHECFLLLLLLFFCCCFFFLGGGGGGGGAASGSLGLLYPRLLGLVYLISLLSVTKGILTENSRMLCI